MSEEREVTEIPKSQNELARYGVIPLGRASAVVIRELNFRGRIFIDIRKFVDTQRYVGWTRKGIAIPKELLPELIKILSLVPSSTEGA